MSTATVPTENAIYTGPPLAVVYGRFQDDKAEGVWLDGIFFGGVGETPEQADDIARSCVSGCRGGTVFAKIIPIRHDNILDGAIEEAKSRIYKMEQEMVENEDTLRNQTTRRK